MPYARMRRNIGALARGFPGIEPRNQVETDAVRGELRAGGSRVQRARASSSSGPLGASRPCWKASVPRSGLGALAPDDLRALRGCWTEDV
jgi:hypothetical protein